MPYQETFIEFWEQVKESYQEGRFAKLTLAKTIGKPNLKNIFVRPLSSGKDLKVLVKLRYQSRDTEDEESELTLDEAFTFLKPYLKTHFWSVLLFTTTKDVTLKINKKGIGKITENAPTFQNVIIAESGF
ncbi:hypothetical protein [Algibacter pectinivorans]|uniref:Uncharacterized protein n=1 Tax=Algibacter pectinivorans TaxID=870482 RepID=A0A1I1QJ09_9FLAO|nr:hypothetical protein [Algibacter pectinivorans]SFD19828.1 hypothetical protein SAMN04487987_10631 [Algibacter pectinivorans]